MTRWPLVVVVWLAFLATVSVAEDTPPPSESAARAVEPSSPSPPLEKGNDSILAQRAAARHLIAAAMQETQSIAEPLMLAGAYDAIAKAQIQAGDLAAAKATVAHGALMTDDLYARIVRAEAEAGDVASARATAERINSPYRKKVSYRAIITALLKTGDVAGALATVSQMGGEPIDRTVFPTVPDEQLDAYLEIARAQIQAGDRSGAVTSLRAAIKPAARGTCMGPHLEIVAVQVELGDKAGAAAMLEIARENAENYHGQGRSTIYGDVFKAQVLAGDLAGAEAAAVKIATQSKKGRPLTLAAYEGIAEGQAEAGDVPGAKATAAKIADADTRAWVEAEIAIQQAKAGDVIGAKATVSQIGNKDAKAWAYPRIAQAQAKAGDVPGAQATVTKIRDKPRRVKVFCAIGQAQVKAGDLVAAIRSFDLAAEAAAPIKERDERRSALFEVAKARMEAGDVAGAKAMAAPFIQGWVYRTIAKTQAQAGDLAAAREALDAARAVDSGEEGYVDVEVVRIQTLCGDFQAARQTAAKISDPMYRQHAYTAIIAAQAKAGDVAGAIEFLNGLKEESALRRCVRLAEAAEQLCSEPSD